MKKYLLLAVFITGLHGTLAQAATQIYKCINATGLISFSDSICPPDTEQSTHSIAQPMLIPALTKQAIKQTKQKHSKQRNKTRVTVVGDLAHPCGIIDLQAQRTARVRKQVKNGMSQAEVESMFGKPLKQDMNNGILTATYRSDKGQKRSVRFDEQGCVRLGKKSAAANSSAKKTENKKKRTKKNLQ